MAQLRLYNSLTNRKEDFSPIDDMRASKDYRVEIAKNLLTKCFAEIKKNKLIRLSY